MSSDSPEPSVRHHYRHIIFDMDGTLDNSMPIYAAAFVSVCAEYGLTGKEVGARYIQTAGTPLHEQFSQAAALAGKDLDLEEGVRRFWEILGPHPANPFPEASTLISALSGSGRNLYLTTGSKTENALRRLDEMGLRHYFKLLLGGEKDLEKGLKHLSRFKEHSGDADFEHQAVYIGDGTADMRFAREFGITAIGITTTLSQETLVASGAQYTITHLLELLPLLQQLDSD